MKKILLSVMITLMSAQTAFGLTIKLNGMLEPVTSVNKNGSTLVSMRDVSELLGADVDWNSVKRCVTLTKGSDKVVLYVDTNTAVKDGKETNIECEIIDDRVMVPLRFVGEAFGAKVDWDEASGNISVNTGEGILNLRKNISQDTILLTFDEAYETAINKNSGLKTLKDAETLLEELEDKYTESLTNIDNSNSYISLFLREQDFTYTDEETLRVQQYTNIVSTINVLRGMLKADKQKDALGINEEIIRDSIELSLRSSVSAIKECEMNLMLLEESIELEEENVKNVELKHSLGYESDYNLNLAKNKLKTLKKNYDLLKLNYEDAKIDLNNILGIDANKDVFVDAGAADDNLKDFNLEDHISRSLNLDPYIKLKLMDLEVAQYNLRTNVAYAGESKIQLQNEYNAAKRALDDAKSNMEKNIRNAYNNVQKIDENETALNLTLEKSKEDYNTVVAGYNAGNATLFDTKKAKIGILNSEIDLALNEQNRSILIFTLKRPYLLDLTSALTLSSSDS